MHIKHVVVVFIELEFLIGQRLTTFNIFVFDLFVFSLSFEKSVAIGVEDFVHCTLIRYLTKYIWRKLQVGQNLHRYASHLQNFSK